MNTQQLLVEIMDHMYPDSLFSRPDGKKKYFIDLDKKKISSLIRDKLQTYLGKIDINNILSHWGHPGILSLIRGYDICSIEQYYEIVDSIIKKCFSISYFEFDHTEQYQQFIIGFIEYRIISLDLLNIKEYVKFLDTNNEEQNYLTSALSPSTTYFFRDDILSEIKSIKKYLKPSLKILVLGCSSGAEVYSLAYSLKETGVEYEILATDINIYALKYAELGVYPESIIKDIPQNIKDTLLINNVIQPGFKEKIQFKQQDITKGYGTEKYNMIVVRSTIKYFDEKTRLQIFDNILNNIISGGILVVGTQEGSNKDISPHKYINVKKIGDFSFQISQGV